MDKYIGIILIERNLVECISYATAPRLLQQVREHGLKTETISEDTNQTLIAHDLIISAIRNSKMTVLIEGMSDVDCVPLQIESWLHWGSKFDRLTSRFDFNKVLAAIEAIPATTAERSAATSDWGELSNKLANVGDETYLICFYLAAMYGPDFDFINLSGNDEEARCYSLVEKCIADCKLVALLSLIDEVGVAAEMPHLQILAASWIAQAIPEDRKCV